MKYIYNQYYLHIIVKNMGCVNFKSKILYVGMTINNKIILHKNKLHRNNSIPAYFDTISFWTVNDITKFNKKKYIIIDYTDFMTIIPSTITGLNYSQLMYVIAEQSNLYDNLPQNISFLLMNMFWYNGDILPKLTNLPINLKTLNVRHVAKINHSEIENNPILNYTIKLPYECKFYIMNNDYTDSQTLINSNDIKHYENVKFLLEIALCIYT